MNKSTESPYTLSPARAVIDESITYDKNLRVAIDGLIQSLRAAPKSAERQLAYRALQQAKHWLGEDLSILGVTNPYPNGTNPANTVVDPTADVAKSPTVV